MNGSRQIRTNLDTVFQIKEYTPPGERSGGINKLNKLLIWQT